MWTTAKKFNKTKKFCISKNYIEYADFDNINEIIDIIKVAKTNYNELICRNDCVKPYFDIESLKPFNIDYIIYTIKSIFYDISGIKLSDNQIYILCCNRHIKEEFKMSYHVIIDGYHFDNQLGAKCFAKYINEFHKEVDINVYSNGLSKYKNVKLC